MKAKSVQVLLLLAFALTFYGCAAFVATPIYGVLYTGVTGPVTYDAGAQSQSYEVLGTVEGSSTATSVFGLIAVGDASVNSAYNNALKKIPGTDDLIEITVDYKGTSFLGLFASYTTIVKAKAIKNASSSQQ